MEEHLGELFTDQEELVGAQQEAIAIAAYSQYGPSASELYELPSADHKTLVVENAAKDNWISRVGRQRREQKGVWYRRKADFLASKTDPHSSPMKRTESKGSHLGYYAHYVVDGGKSRIILNALVAPFEVTENAPMLDLLWRSTFRWKLHPRQVTGDTAYGTTENIAAVERAGIRAYVPLSGAGQARPYFSKEEFVYDPEQNIYQCPAGKVLRPKTIRAARNQILYKTEPGRCDRCSLRSQCTDNKSGPQVLRHLQERYVDRVKS